MREAAPDVPEAWRGHRSAPRRQGLDAARAPRCRVDASGGRIPQVLYVIGSPRPHGVSRQLGEAFLQAYREKHPNDVVDVIDVWAEDLPPFAGAAADGKLKGMSGVPLPPEEQEAFDRVLVYIKRLKSADKVVVSTGMWNFSMPYRLKHYFDLVLQAGHTFGFDPSRGYFGLVTGKPVQLLLSSGGDYTQGPMSQADKLGPYLAQLFGFMGFTDIRTLTAACTAYPPEVSGPAIAAAVEAAKEAGASF